MTEVSSLEGLDLYHWISLAGYTYALLYLGAWGLLAWAGKK